MLYSVVYSVDCPRDVSIVQFLPKQRKLFDTTEDDSSREYSYLGGEWEKGKHRKLCALLDRKQFERFLDDTGMRSEDVETMGTIGAPGFGFGIVPAIAFKGDDIDSIQSAYVTPVPEKEPPDDEERQHRIWERLRRALIKLYRSGATDWYYRRQR